MNQILAADIGGTNSRFGVFETAPGQEPWLALFRVLPTTSVRSFAELLARLAASGLRADAIPAACVVLAVAGPVRGERCRLTNAAWEIDLGQANGLPVARTELINDFVAQAMGCLTSHVRSSAVTVQAGTTRTGVLAAVGAGTGLGACALAPLPDAPGHFLPIPSEAGHAPLAFLTEREAALQTFITRQTGQTHAHGDTVVSGRGLTFMHWFLTGKKLSPAEVAAEIGPDSETTAWFARFYGRICRVFALHVLPLGGLFLCGGLAAKNTHFVTHPEFLREFTDCPAYADLLADIPVRLVTSPEAGLHGAAAYGRMLLDRPFPCVR